MSEKDIQVMLKELPQVFTLVEIPDQVAENYIWIDIPDPGTVDWLGQIVDQPINDLGNEEINLDADFFDPDAPFGIGESDDFTSPATPISSEEVGNRTGTSGRFPGLPTSTSAGAPRPPTDSLAFYLPFHIFGQTWWGVYLTVEGVWYVATEIWKSNPDALTRRECWVAARLYLFYHEIFHHNVESLAARLEVAHRAPMYITGFQKYYDTTFGTSACIEESLAEANALRKTVMNFPSGVKRDAVRIALENFISVAPPGYREGLNFVSTKKFNDGKNCLAEHSLNYSLPALATASPALWNAARYMTRGFSDKGKGRAKYLIHRSSPLANRLPMRPRLTPSKLKRKLEAYGCRFHRQGGGHEIWIGANGARFSIPRHPGDLGTGLISAIMKQAGISASVRDFMTA